MNAAAPPLRRRLRAAAAYALVSAAALSALCPPAVAAPDAALLAAARGQEAAVIESLRELVAIESGSANGEGLARIADYAEARLKALGARTEKIRATRGPGSLVKGTLIGSGTKRLMLIGHMDTVYPVGILATQPYKRDGNRLYGPGIADDKGGIAVVFHTLAILQQAGWKDYAQVTVLLNSDEELGSIGSGEIIAATADEHDVVFSAEPTAAKDVAKNEGLLLGASGTATATMEVKGRASHAGAAPDLGRNALVELAYQIQQTKDVAKGVPGAQLNWTAAQAGVVRNQIPEKATASADVRLTRTGAAEQLLAALQQKIAAGRLVADTETQVTLQIGRPPFLANERARALARRAQEVYAELDGRVLRLDDMTGGATDAAYAGRSGKALVIESFGLAGFGYHARDEYIEIDSIVPRLYLMARMLQEAAKR